IGPSMPSDCTTRSSVGRRCGPSSVTEGGTGVWLIGVDVDRAADVVEHVVQRVVVRVAHSDIRVGEIAGRNWLGRCAGVREVRVDHPLAVSRLGLVDARVAAYCTVAVGTQRHYAGGVLPRRLTPDL